MAPPVGITTAAPSQGAPTRLGTCRPTGDPSPRALHHPAHMGLEALMKAS